MKNGVANGKTLRDGWHKLNETEHRALDALLRRSHRVRNVNQLEEERLTPGQRLADNVTRQLGSWRFIIIQSTILAAWITVNTFAWIRHWDPYPFILLNLALSFQAAYAAPIIMMSQNREAAKDRLRAEEDYHVNLRAELEVQAIHERLDDLSGRQWQTLMQIQAEQLTVLARIESLTAEIHRKTTNAEGRT
jgi:uncharacterized membrane protein